ncbi:uncharacterized protein LOC143428858 [Xylocopa sonorina]|uniref:uncharacterized protein LOC143428858 n=1 Tax=Xylocopa sonorina TaxID=1818115 RepID=UPI00403B2CFE
MLRREVAAVLAFSALSLANAMPQDGDKQDSSRLPLFQFTNDGVRFNFGGYHAQAGLGGLLSGSRTGGGLHASAGTPWGANAAAGLGGSLGGDDATAGGGLYARAGLGNGRHEAGAGLGGLLDGSGRSLSPLRGGLYAGATTGNRGIGIMAGRPLTGPSASGGNNEGSNQQSGQGSDAGKSGGGRSNIQVISRSGKKQDKEVTSVEDVASKDLPAGKEIREVHSSQSAPLASSEVSGGLSANAAPEVPSLQSIGKVKLFGDTIEPAPLVPPLPNEADDAYGYRRVRIFRPKKRFWSPRKQVIIDYVPPVEAEEVVKSNIQKRQTNTRVDIVPGPGNRVPIRVPNGDGFFDDIFKIPISTLGAVNEFLNNNAG